MKRTYNLLSNEKGFGILYAVIISTFVLFLFMLTAISGHAKIVDHIAYKIADASALAGASQFSYISTSPDPWEWGGSTTYIPVIDEKLARERAEELFENNKKSIEYFVQSIEPTYTKVSDNEYSVSLKITYQPLYSSTPINRTIKAVARVKPEI